ncbi:hypothetical protein Ahy_B09g100238 [Arachis hypogaea]|uniref:ADF-H domain-containing protein n=2 Tax=Arachis hypogaea TaxID=3818 RepID=A0A444XW67_ARAHY|nr:hypothetical protein Ahy_B09g100238 [Arachis hypogaea]
MDSDTPNRKRSRDDHSNPNPLSSPQHTTTNNKKRRRKHNHAPTPQPPTHRHRYNTRPKANPNPNPNSGSAVVQQLKETGAENPQLFSKHELAAKLVDLAGKENGQGKYEGAALQLEPEEKLSKNARRRRKNKNKNNALNNEVAEAEPTKHNHKNKEKKKSKRLLRSNVSESNNYNSESTDEIPLRTGNANSPHHTRSQGTKALLTGVAYDEVCQSCQVPGHKFWKCPKRKGRHIHEEICFFCGEFGHTLAKCSVSTAGGGRFARCLLCFAHGHFTNKCPQTCHGISMKEVAANGPIDKRSLPLFLSHFFSCFFPKSLTHFLSHFSFEAFSINDDIMANAASGMAVNDACKLKFLELKAKRNYRFIVFRIENQEVVVEKVGSPDETYDDFTASLPANECRYAVFDFDFTTDENCQKSKIFFIAWAPDTSRVREKMVYASSKDRFKRELDGIQVELQATDPSEMSFDIIKARAI